MYMMVMWPSGKLPCSFKMINQFINPGEGAEPSSSPSVTVLGKSWSVKWPLKIKSFTQTNDIS